jgi:hypothetical protein
LQQNNLNLVANKTYKLTFDIEITTVNQAYIWIGNGGGSVNYTGTNYQFYPTGSHTVYFQMPSNQTTLGFYGSQTGGAFYMNNISLIEITDDTDLPRINYTNFDYENGEVVPYSGTGSLLLEPQSTNLIQYSEDFSQSYWSKTRTEVYQNTTISPDGSLNASTLSVVNANGGEEFLRRISISSSPATSSIYVKKGNWRYITFRSLYLSVFDFDTETFTFTGANEVVSFEKLQNGWYRLKANSLTRNYCSVGFARDATSPTAGSNVNGANMYIWGAQLEEGSYATSYIPTNGEVNGVTRLADVCNNAGSSDLINSTEGVLYVEALLKNTGTFKTAARITATDISTGDGLWIYFRSDNKIQGVLRVGGVDQTGIISSVQTTDEYYKVAFKFKQNDFSLFVNGIEVATDTSGNTFSANTLSKLGFVLGTSTNPFIGNVKTVAVFEALDNDQLERLTGEGYESFNLLAQANNYTII